MFDHLSKLAQSIIKEKYSLKNIKVEFLYSGKEGFGDLSSSVPLQIAGMIKKPPKAVAEAISAELLNKGNAFVERCTATANGYVNVWLKPAVMLELLNDVRTACVPAVKREESPVIIDYCGPNIAKPLGIHHILSHVIGQAIVNIYRHLGYNVIGWSYPGDWGTQFGKLAVAFERWGKGKKASDCAIDELLALYVKFHESAENDPSLESAAREAFGRLEKGDEKMLSFWDEIVFVSMKDLRRLYRRINVEPDIETGESFYRSKTVEIIDEGVKKKVFKKGEEGALIAEFSGKSGLPPFMVRKSDGSTLYATRDIAMIRYRISEYKPSAIYYVVDSAQSLHFKQLFEACRRLKWDLPELEHTVFGRMRFKDEGMSTRKGTAIKLEDVLDEAVKRADAKIKEHSEGIKQEKSLKLAEMMGVGALVYGVISQNRKMDIVFDWDKFLSFEGNSAPYLQYTHARACSVIRNSGGAVPELQTPEIESFTQCERGLINLLLQFARILNGACESRMPHLLANYLYDLCREFNSFYNSEPILKAGEPRRSLRLTLTSLTADVIKTGAGILTISVPDRM